MTKRISDSPLAGLQAQQARRAAEVQRTAKTAAAVKKLKGKDEFSTGMGKALRVKALALGSVPLSHVRPSAPTPPASQSDKAAADAQRIATRAKTDPQGASAELKQAMNNPDPAYHAALIAKSGPVMTEIAHGLRKAKPDVIKATITNLGEISQAAGPEGAAALGTAFAKGLDGGLGGFSSIGDLKVPTAPGTEAFLQAMLSTPGMGDFVNGMVEGAKANKNLALFKDLDALITTSASLATSTFESAQKKVDQLNSELSSLIEGFGPGDEAKLHAAVAAFKKRHEKEYAALETTAAAMTNVLSVAGPLLEAGKLDLDTAATVFKALSLMPQVLATQAGQAELGRQLDAQARGESAPLLELALKATEGKDGAKLREQVGPLLTQAYATRIAALKADGRDDEAHALIDSMGQNAALFGVKPADLKELQGALGDALDGKPGAIEDIKVALSTLGPFLPEGSSLAGAFKGLGFVIGVAGLGGSFDGFTDAQIENQVGTIASTLGLGVDGASLAVRVFGNPGSQASLEKLFGKASTVTGVIGAVVGVIDFAQTAENGSIGDVAVSGLNAASGILMLIPGGQIAGVGLALASFALNEFLGARRQREAEHASEADAKAFLIAAGLDEEFAKVFSNLNDNKKNIGTFVEQVAKELGLTQDELFEKLNASTGKDREKLLKTFKELSAAAEALESFGAEGELPIFGPPLTLEDLKGLPDFVSQNDRQKIVDGINARRAEIVEQVAGSIESLID